MESGTQLGLAFFPFTDALVHRAPGKDPQILSEREVSDQHAQSVVLLYSVGLSGPSRRVVRRVGAASSVLMPTHRVTAGKREATPLDSEFDTCLSALSILVRASRMVVPYVFLIRLWIYVYTRTSHTRRTLVR